MSERSDALRRSFDEAFARAPVEATADTEDLLVIRIASDPYAVRVGAASCLASGRVLLQVPGPIPELLGVTTLRGSLLPVYALGALLGYAADASVPAWLLVCEDGAARAAFAFDRFERYVRVPATDVTAAVGQAGREHVRELVRTEAGVCGVLDVGSVLAEIKRRIGALGRGKG